MPLERAGLTARVAAIEYQGAVARVALTTDDA